jgi:hypothetical protein
MKQPAASPRGGPRHTGCSAGPHAHRSSPADRCRRERRDHCRRVRAPSPEATRCQARSSRAEAATAGARSAVGRCQLNSGRDATNQRQRLLPENPRHEPALVRLRQRAEPDCEAIAMFSDHDCLRPDLDAIEHERALALRADRRKWTADDVMNDPSTTCADVDGSIELEGVFAPREREAQTRLDPHSAAAIPHPQMTNRDS